MNVHALYKRIRSILTSERRRLLFSLLLVVACLGLTTTVIYAWYLSNTQVQSDGMAVSSGFEPKISYCLAPDYGSEGVWEVIDGNDQLNLSALLERPGASAGLLVKVENVGTGSFSVDSIGLLAPDAGEETANSAGVYLGTQLYASLDQVDSTDAAENKAYLAELDAENQLLAGDVLLFDSTNTVDGSGQTIGPVILSAGEEVIFKVTIVFENRDEPQDAFKHFGESLDGHCSRRIFAECNGR